jgi:hypothetical protein
MTLPRASSNTNGLNKRASTYMIEQSLIYWL